MGYLRLCEDEFKSRRPFFFLILVCLVPSMLWNVILATRLNKCTLRLLSKLLDGISPGRPLIPEAPEPGYFALRQELISALQLINGTMALSSVAHSVALQGSSFFPNEHNSIANHLWLASISNKFSINWVEDWEPYRPSSPPTSKMEDGYSPKKIIKSERVSFMQWNSLRGCVFYQHKKHGDHVKFLCQINWNWFRPTTTVRREVLLAQDRTGKHLSGFRIHSYHIALLWT